MKFPRGPALGLFGLFGRSADLRQLDDAFRRVDVHPRLVPEAVKLTIVNLLREQMTGRELAEPAIAAAAELVGYCMIGAESFAGANSVAHAEAIERRIEAALVAGTSLDASLILLVLEAKLMQPSVRDMFGLEAASR